MLWHNPTTGNAEIWKIANNQWAGSVSLGTHNTDWQPAGVGDFNGDGTSDILWYNPTTGATEILEDRERPMGRQREPRFAQHRLAAGGPGRFQSRRV